MFLLFAHGQELVAAAIAAGCTAGAAAGAAARRLFPQLESCSGSRLAESAAGAASFCFAAACAEDMAQLAWGWLLAFLLLIHCFTDYGCCLLADGVTLALALAGIGRSFVSGGLPQAASGAAVAGVALLAAYYACRGGMGFGDVKLAGALGVWLGPEQSLLMLFLACTAGGVPALLLLLFRLKRPGDAIPFGPFLCVAALVSFFYGRILLEWYFKFI